VTTTLRITPALVHFAKEVGCSPLDLQVHEYRNTTGGTTVDPGYIIEGTVWTSPIVYKRGYQAFYTLVHEHSAREHAWWVSMYTSEGAAQHDHPTGMTHVYPDVRKAVVNDEEA
jgi:hypothetical protein